MFAEERVAQMAAYLLQQQRGHMPYLKLMKLLYLADREAMGRFGESISGDHMVSMPHGPVLSQTLDLIKGYAPVVAEQGWNYWIAGEANYEVSLKQAHAERDDFDELSDVDIEILNKVWGQFGHMKPFDIVQYTHDHCAEWIDPQGSSFPIKPEAVFCALGKPHEVAVELAKHLREQQQLDAVVSGLR